MSDSLVNVERRDGGVALVEHGRELKRRILQEHERILFPLMADEARILRERVLGSSG